MSELLHGPLPDCKSVLLDLQALQQQLDPFSFAQLQRIHPGLAQWWRVTEADLGLYIYLWSSEWPAGSPESLVFRTFRALRTEYKDWRLLWDARHLIRELAQCQCYVVSWALLR